VSQREVKEGHIDFLDLNKAEIDMRLRVVEAENQRSVAEFNETRERAEQLKAQI
jgi:hypothetical protein